MTARLLRQIDAAEATVALYVDLLAVARRHGAAGEAEVERLERNLAEHRSDLAELRSSAR